MNSWNIGKVAGIQLRIHWTFVLLPLWIYFSSILGGRGVFAAASAVLFVLAIFGCVLLHELGHALAAAQFQIRTRDITLFPLGGLAALERMPREPWQELWIAVAGPLVNVVIAALLYFALPFVSSLGEWPAEFAGRLMLGNVVLVVFNLIPAFPMDGGRVLRSIMAMFLPYSSATSVAVGVGQVMAILMGLAGLALGQLGLLLVAAFVFFAGRAEQAHVRRSGLGAGRAPAGQSWSNQNAGWQVGGFGNAGPRPFGQQSSAQPEFGAASAGREYSQPDIGVPASLPIDSVAQWLDSQSQEVCTVMDAGRAIGRITRSQLIVAIYRGMGSLPVGNLLGTVG